MTDALEALNKWVDEVLSEIESHHTDTFQNVPVRHLHTIRQALKEREWHFITDPNDKSQYPPIGGEVLLGVKLPSGEVIHTVGVHVGESDCDWRVDSDRSELSYSCDVIYWGRLRTPPEKSND